MQTYKDKSQEELRSEDYQLGDKGQRCGSSFGVSGPQGFGVIDNTRPFIPPVFNQSIVDQPSYYHFPSSFVVERAGVEKVLVAQKLDKELVSRQVSLANSFTFRESLKWSHHQLCLLLKHNLQSKPRLITRIW